MPQQAFGAETLTTIPAKRKWWSWLLVYPTAFGAVLGAIPTGIELYKAMKYDINFGQVRHAEEQRRLWIRNFKCAQSMSFQTVTTEKKVLVQVGACKNGDVLIEIVPPDKNRIVEWISLERLQTASASVLPSLIGKAVAAHVEQHPPYSPRRKSVRVAQGNINVICQKLEGQTKIIRIVKENGKCFREEIAILQGKVANRKEVPCNTPCQ